MDEQPVQLQRETRQPRPATLQHGKRVDYEYERAGTACAFMFTEPLAGWRQVSPAMSTASSAALTSQMKVNDARYKLASVYPKIRS